MRYTVARGEAALNEQANLWMAATDRGAVRTAADRIDRVLSRDAHLKGQGFYGDRLLVDPPLAVVFTVSRDDRVATVVSVYASPA